MWGQSGTTRGQKEDNVWKKKRERGEDGGRLEMVREITEEAVGDEGRLEEISREMEERRKRRSW